MGVLAPVVSGEQRVGLEEDDMDEDAEEAQDAPDPVTEAEAVKALTGVDLLKATRSRLRRVDEKREFAYGADYTRAYQRHQIMRLVRIGDTR